MPIHLLQHLDLDRHHRLKPVIMPLHRLSKSVYCASKRGSDHRQQKKYRVRGEDSGAARKLEISGDANGI